MYERINEDLKNAMKAKDTFSLSVLRMLKSALQLEQINKKHELSDSEVSQVLKKQVKVRKDSLEEYKKYNKEELVESLEKEIVLLSKYLPKEMSSEEIVKLVDEVITNLNATSIKDMGAVMKKVNELLEGKNADMSYVSKIVKEKLASKNNN